MFLARIIILLIFNFINPTLTLLIDFSLIFAGPFFLVSLIDKIKNKFFKADFQQNKSITSSSDSHKNISPIDENLPSSVSFNTISTDEKILKCSKCLKEYSHGNKYCSICGTPLSDNSATNSPTLKYDANSGQPFNRSEYPAYLFSESYDCLDKFLKEKLSNPEYQNASLATVENKKNLVTLYTFIMTILLIIYFSYHASWVHQVYKEVLEKKQSSKSGYFEYNLTNILKEYYAFISKDKPNNLFFTTNDLRDYHYTKQKSNVYYHIDTINLPFQNIKFYYLGGLENVKETRDI